MGIIGLKGPLNSVVLSDGDFLAFVSWPCDGILVQVAAWSS